MNSASEQQERRCGEEDKNKIDLEGMFSGAICAAPMNLNLNLACA